MLKAIRKSLPMLLNFPPDRHQKTSRCCCKKVVMYFLYPTIELVKPLCGVIFGIPSCKTHLVMIY